MPSNLPRTRAGSSSGHVIGIDTGGTHTDGVLLDDTTRTVLASAKTLTTPGDLSCGIAATLRALDVPDPARVNLIGISSTLATNSIAEGKGRPVGLALIGYDRDLVVECGLESRLSTPRFEYFRGGHDSSGREREPVDLEGIRDWVLRHRLEMDALAVSSYFSPLDPSHEIAARQAIADVTRLPVVLGHELSTRLDSVKRATTAALNASLVAVMRDFIEAVRRALARLDISAPLMVVKGDGSLIRDPEALLRPVTTVLSGPAASAVGGHFFSERSDAVVIDMGGTTTDIALIQDSRLAISDDGVSVGEFSTCVQAADVTTLCIGCDSHISFGIDRDITVGPRRVVPLCRMAAGFPEMDSEIARLHSTQSNRRKPSDLEYWFCIGDVDSDDLDWADDEQRRLVRLLRQRPLSLTRILHEMDAHHEAGLNADRLFSQGLIEKAALTPTDILHVMGRMDLWHGAVARLALDFASGLKGIAPETFSEAVIDFITSTVTEMVIVFLARHRGGGDLPGGLDGPWGRWLREQVLGDPSQYVSVNLRCEFPIIGIGAPAGLLLDQVADRLNTPFILPPHHEVANAVGAVAGSVAASRQALLYTQETSSHRSYRVQIDGRTVRFDAIDEARLFARAEASKAAIDAAEQGGAVDPALSTEVSTQGSLESITARAVGNPARSAKGGDTLLELPAWQSPGQEQEEPLQADADGPLLTVKPTRETLRLIEGETVRDGLLRMGNDLETPCNGEGVCGKCRVWVDDPVHVPETDHELITVEEASRGLRLACKLVPRTDIAIELTTASGIGSCQPVASILAPRTPGPPSRGVDPAVTVRRGPAGHIVSLSGEPEDRPLERWSTQFEPKGLALDLGTTTLVASLVSLRTGEVLSTESARNPQTRFGYDVITRIQHASSREGLEELADIIHETLNRLVTHLCEDTHSDACEILDIVIGANPTMLQLASKMNPSPLGQAPFRVDIPSATYHPAKRFGLEVNPVARVYVPPVLHAFVGSDVTAGLIAIRAYIDDADSTLFVDIGTNGELVLQDGDRHLVTSAAAGPAFEGMGLHDGMRAVDGAVRSVHARGDRLEYRTIGDRPASGICGTGIIDLTAALRKAKVLDVSGKMASDDTKDGISERIARDLEDEGGQRAYRLSEDVLFTQRDVRQVQLAKSAIRTAIEMLLDRGGRAACPDRVIVGGSFGSALRAQSMERIGMIPPMMAERFIDAGNTSLDGCLSLLRNVGLRRELAGMMGEFEHVSLNLDPDYMERYVANMEFPASP